MILDFLKQLFGDDPTGAPASGVARLEVTLPPDRSRAGSLRALDGAGVVVAGPWPVTAKADPALAAARGNPDCDWRLACGETPTGTYQVVARLQGTPRSLGPHEALMLRALSGQAATAEANGRALLMIHGGRPGAATDGSLRLPDAAMGELLALLPPDPATLVPPLRVVIEEREDAAAEEDDWDQWSWQGPLDEETGDLVDFLARVYLWDALSESGPAAPEAEDAAAIEGLRDLGYDTLPDGDAPPAPAADAPPEADRVGDSCVRASAVSEDDGNAPACGDAWTPAEGAYDR